MEGSSKLQTQLTRNYIQFRDMGPLAAAVGTFFFFKHHACHHLHTIIITLPSLKCLLYVLIRLFSFSAVSVMQRLMTLSPVTANSGTPQSSVLW